MPHRAAADLFQGLLALGFLAIAAAASAQAQTPAGQPVPTELKWKPHRAATAAAQPEPEAATVAPATEPAVSPALDMPAKPLPSGPPASVALPPDVPPLAGTSPSPSYAPFRGRTAPKADASPSANRLPGSLRQTFDPSNPWGILDIDLVRAPQGDAPRPILAAEGRQAMAMQRAAGRTASDRGEADRLGGGLAPRFAPGTSPRPERLAMKMDGVPSVMTRAPQVSALDDAAVPGRAPPGAGATQALPAPPSAADTIGLPEGPTLIESPPADYGPLGESSADPSMIAGPDGLMLGDYPPQMHVESFYDDPYECEDDEALMPCLQYHGRICMWLRQFGKPYYGWHWYRDFTASAGVMGFTNGTNLGLNGNFGTNEYLNWAMPFWNAFGVGWQIGARATQSGFQSTTVTTATGRLQTSDRQQVFITSGFFTRAFEGRGLQGGAAYDYLNDNWFDNVDVSQIRGELSYVWGYHEFGAWTANNIANQISIFGTPRRHGATASTVDMYCGFYRLQFGDANEWKIWGGATGDGDGIVGSLLRAPMSRSLALEGTFTYLIPKNSQQVDIDELGNSISFSPAAWNVGLNLVYYPAGRSRRSLASPYRPLFDVADNGSMIRSITR